LHLPSPEFLGEVLASIVFCIAAQADNPLQAVRISADEKIFLRGAAGPLQTRNAGNKKNFFIVDIKNLPLSAAPVLPSVAIGRDAPVGKRCLSQDPAPAAYSAIPGKQKCKLCDPLAILQTDRLGTGFIGE
jgi:hypothetical protein